MARKDHLAVLTDAALGSYEGWLREGLSMSFVDYPQWIQPLMRSELASVLAEKAMRDTGTERSLTD